MLDDVKNTRRTRFARSWGSYPTVPRSVVVPRWRGKRCEHTPRSGHVTDSRRRAFSSSWLGGGAKDFAKGGAKGGARSGANGDVNGDDANGGVNGCPMPPGDGVNMERWFVQSSSSPFVPLRQGRVERFQSTEKWGCRLEGRNDHQRAGHERDPGTDTGRTPRGTRQRVKIRAPGYGLQRMCLRRGSVAIGPPGDFRGH